MHGKWAGVNARRIAPNIAKLPELFQRVNAIVQNATSRRPLPAALSARPGQTANALIRPPDLPHFGRQLL